MTNYFPKLVISTFRFPISVESANQMEIFYQQFVGKFDTPPKLEAGQNFYFEVHIQITIISTNT